MSQLNLHLDPHFERALTRLMRLRGVPTKSEAVRLAVQETLERAQRPAASADFACWKGAALAAEPNPEPRFRSDDDSWQGDRS